MNIIVNLSSYQIDTMKHDLLDVNLWVSNIITSLVNKGKVNLFQDYLPKIIGSVESMPATDGDFIDCVLARDDYVNNSVEYTPAEVDLEASLSIAIDLSDIESVYIYYSVANLNKYIDDIITSKVEACSKRMIAEYYPILMNDQDVEIIPANKIELISCIKSHKDYMNRSDRELSSEDNKPCDIKYLDLV